MEQITTVGIDLAKNVFSLHGVDAAGKTVLRRTVRRDRLVETVAQLSPCLIGMEACSGKRPRGCRSSRGARSMICLSSYAGSMSASMPTTARSASRRSSRSRPGA